MLDAYTGGGYRRTLTYFSVDEADRQKLRREITESRYPSRTSPRGQRVDGDAVAAQIPALGMMLARLFQKRCAFMGDEKIVRSEEHTSELQSLMRISYAVFCLKKKNT